MRKIASKISYLVRKLETSFYTLILNKKNTLIVITGCGRSGTTYSSKVLRQMGLKIGHERLRKDGVSSWFMSSNRVKVPSGPSLNDLKGFKKVIIHQVREPLPSISSMLSTGSPSWKFLSKEIPISLDKDSKILKAMKYYYYWNKQTERIADVRLKAEEFNEVIKDVLNKHEIGFKADNVKLNKKSKVNTRKHAKLSWEDLYKEDKDLTEKIKNLGKRYGY